MKKVLLDTNFILTCVRQKIDFFEELYFEGFHIFIPSEVVEELKKIASSDKSLKFKEPAKIALKLIKKSKHSEIKLDNKNVDKGIIHLAKENPEWVIGTLDREMRGRITNHKLVIRGKKKLWVI